MPRARPQRPRSGRPPGADADATRRLILEAALEAFASVGYEAVSVRELTRSLGVSHNLVHHYFGSKLKLWRAVIDYAVGDAIGQVAEGLDRALEERDPFESLADAIREAVELFARMPALPRMLAFESGMSGERLDYVFTRYLDPFFGVVERFAERIQRAGGSRLDPRSFALALLTASGSLVTHAPLARQLGGPDPSSPAALERHIETLVTLVLDGLRPRN